MAAENIDNTVNGTGMFPTKVPGLSDAADIQAALRLYHYGSYTYDGANTNTANLVNPSIAKHLQNLVDADAAEVTNRNSAITTHNADTTDVHGIENTANLATKVYVDTAVSGAIGGVVGEFSNLAGTAIDWNSVDERFDVEPRLANSGTVVTKTESFTLSPDDVGKTAILYSSNPMTVTLPENSSVVIPVGYSIDIIQTGTGSVTVTEGSGAVSINSKSNIKSLDGQYSKGTLVKIADNTWFFFGNLLNTVTPTAPTPVAPTPTAPTPTAPTPTAPTPTAPTPTAPIPVAPTPTAPTPTPPQLPTPSLSVSTGPGAGGTVYANITVGNFDYNNSYSSTLGSQNPEYPEEWNIEGLTSGQSYTVYITASRSGYTSAQGSITFNATSVTPTAPTPTAPTPTAPTPTGPTVYNIYTACDPLIPASRGGYYGTQTAGGYVNVGTTSNPSLTSEQIVALLGYGSSCPVIPVVNPGTVYVAYCLNGQPYVETYAVDENNILTTNINEACAVYTTVLANSNATNIDCSTTSARTAPSCSTAPTPTAPTPVAPTPTEPTPVAPTPTAPTPTEGLLACPGQATNPVSITCQELGLGAPLGNSSTYSVPSGWQCCAAATPTAPTPTAPTPTAPTPVALDCSACVGYGTGITANPTYTYNCSDGCGTYTVCHTAIGCANYNLTECPGCGAAPTPTAPTPTAPTPTAPTPVAPTAPTPTECVANCVFDGYTCSGWSAIYTYVNYGCGGAAACPPYTDPYGCA